MPRTMTANIPGAKLREAERQLAMLRGPDALNAFMEQHPNEIKVLEQLVEWRRAGKPTPSLARVQRVMLWSDGEIELKTDPLPERGGAPGRGPLRGPVQSGGRPRTGGPAGGRPGSGGPGGAGSAGGVGARPGGFGGPGARPGGFGGGSRGPAGSGRPGGAGAAGGTGGAGRGRPGGSRDRRFGDDDGSSRGVPRAGEGWMLLRQGEKPPENQRQPWEEDEQDVVDQAEGSEMPVPELASLPSPTQQMGADSAVPGASSRPAEPEHSPQ